MEKNEYRKHYEMEEAYWWFSGKRSVVKSFLRHFLSNGNRTTLLDVGCGTGFNLKYFQNYFDAFGCDVTIDALHYAQQRNLNKLVLADAQILPFQSESMDMIFLLDVLYHRRISDDTAVLGEVQRILKNNGYLLITDSALPFLKSHHDIVLHARERYKKKELIDKISKAGFVIEKVSYYNFFLFFGIAPIRLFQRYRSHKNNRLESNLSPIHPAINTALCQVLKAEAFLLRFLRFPLGTSIICLAKKSPRA